jgi:hypothetical protein
MRPSSSTQGPDSAPLSIVSHPSVSAGTASPADTPGSSGQLSLGRAPSFSLSPLLCEGHPALMPHALQNEDGHTCGVIPVPELGTGSDASGAAIPQSPIMALVRSLFVTCVRNCRAACYCLIAPCMSTRTTCAVCVPRCYCTPLFSMVRDCRCAQSVMFQMNRTSRLAAPEQL